MALSARALVALALGLALHHAASQPIPTPAPGSQPPGPQGFIRISGGKFVDDTCNEFLFHGWNGWRLLDYSLSNPAYITGKFRQAQAAKLGVMRFFVADEDNPVIQTAPGVFDERVARGLDFILAEAANHGIRLTVVLLNMWKKNNGVSQFEQWCGTAGSNYKPRPDIDLRQGSTLADLERLQTPYDWFQSPKCRQQVKDYMTALVTRRNSITGVLYKDDPTIFSWNVLNEPRCKYCGPEAVNSWIGEMAAHLKSVDPNHLVTTGEEGFFDESDPMASYNPNDAMMWASRSGQDFRANHAHAAIDYAVIHMWPDNWRTPHYQTEWGKQWIEAHAKVASELVKPLVLEEFGKLSTENDITSTRDPWFEMVHGVVDRSLQSGGPLRGALFWQWDGKSGRSGSTNSIQEGDSTFSNHIVPFAHRMAGGGRPAVPGCTPRQSAGPALAASGRLAQVQTFSSANAGRKILSDSK